MKMKKVKKVHEMGLRPRSVQNIRGRKIWVDEGKKACFCSKSMSPYRSPYIYTRRNKGLLKKIESIGGYRNRVDSWVRGRGPKS